MRGEWWYGISLEGTCFYAEEADDEARNMLGCVEWGERERLAKELLTR